MRIFPHFQHALGQGVCIQHALRWGVSVSKHALGQGVWTEEGLWTGRCGQGVDRGRGCTLPPPPGMVKDVVGTQTCWTAFSSLEKTVHPYCVTLCFYISVIIWAFEFDVIKLLFKTGPEPTK